MNTIIETEDSITIISEEAVNKLVETMIENIEKSKNKKDEEKCLKQHCVENV